MAGCLASVGVRGGLSGVVPAVSGGLSSALERDACCLRQVWPSREAPGPAAATHNLNRKSGPAGRTRPGPSGQPDGTESFDRVMLTAACYSCTLPHGRAGAWRPRPCLAVSGLHACRQPACGTRGLGRGPGKAQVARVASRRRRAGGGTFCITRGTSQQAAATPSPQKFLPPFSFAVRKRLRSCKSIALSLLAPVPP